MRKNFLLLFLLTLLPLAGWADPDPQPLTGNIGVQLSTTMTKEYGDADPVYLAPTDFVIISNTTADQSITEEDLVNVLKFKRKQGQEGETLATYDYEVTVNAESAFATANPDVTIVATNTGRITITPKTLTAAMIGDIEGAPFTFDGQAKTPTPTVSYVKNPEADLADQVLVTLTPGVHFDFEYADNVHAGTAKVIIKAKDSHYADPGTQANPFANKEFTINPRAVTAANLSVVLAQDVFTYTGSEIKPELTVKDKTLGENGTLRADDDYTVAYTKNVNATANAGDTKLTVSAKEGGDYTFDAVDKNFTINKAPLTISIPVGQKKVFGTADDPELVVQYGIVDGENVINGFVNDETAEGLAELTDPQFVLPTLERVAGENAGVYAINITNKQAVIDGATNYEVTIAEGTVNFSIQPKDLSEDANVTLTNKQGDDYIYNSEEHFKNVGVTLGGDPLTENVDYTFATTNNENAGEATVTVTFKGNYKGSKTENFVIVPAPIYIQPLSGTKPYNTSDPEFGYKLVDGNGDDVEGATLNGEVTLLRTGGETVGAYTIYVQGYEAGEGDNYALAEAQANLLGEENIDEEGALTALFTITGSEGTLYLKFKNLAAERKTKVYGTENPVWSIEDLEVDNSVEGGLACADWDDIKYSFGDPVFKLKSEDVDYEGNYAYVENQLASPIYPTVVVSTLPFTVTPKEIALTVANQEITYGDEIKQLENDDNAFELAEGYELAENDAEEGLAVLDVTLAVANLGTYGPGSAAEHVIIATVGNPNYVLAEEGNTWGNLTVSGDIPALALDDSKDDNLIKINAYNGKQANVSIKFSKRDADPKFFNLGTWKGGFWTTLVLPFDIDVATLSQKFGYAIVNVINPEKTVVNGTNSEFYGTLTMKGGNGYVDAEDATKNDTKLAANKPILIKIADDIKTFTNNEYVVNFGTQKIVAPTDLTVDAGEDAKFVGTYEKKTIGKGTDFNDGNIWFMLGDYAKWAYINANSTTASWDIVPFAAYIDMSEVTVPVEAMTFHFEEIDGTVTAIKSINSDEIHGMTAKGMYNLNGMKLNSVPTQKGVYIVNGKKVVIK